MSAIALAAITDGAFHHFSRFIVAELFVCSADRIAYCYSRPLLYVAIDRYCQRR